MFETNNKIANSSKFSDSRTIFVFSVLFFRITLDICYVTYLSPAFLNHQLTPFEVDFSALQYLESYIWLIAGIAILPYQSAKSESLAFFVIIVFLLAPASAIYGLDDRISREVLVLTVMAIYIVYFITLPRALGKGKMALPENGKKILLSISIIFCLIFVLLAIVTGAIFNMNFDVDKVYDFRRELGSKVDIGIFGYTNLWTQKVFTPAILAIGLQRKSITLIVFSLLMHLLFFGVTQHRAHLFTPMLLFFAWYLYRRPFSYSKGFFSFAIALLLTNAVVIYFNLESLAALTIRRSLFVGPSVTYSWIDFFADRPKAYFADNLLSSFLQNPYTGVNLPYYIGEFKMPGTELAFNAGLVGAGYAQLGAFGVALYAAILGYFVRLNARLVEAGVPVYIMAAILFFPYRIAWADSDLLTALLSHGIIVGTFAVWLFGRPTVMGRSGSRGSGRSTKVARAKGGRPCFAN